MRQLFYYMLAISVTSAIAGEFTAEQCLDRATQSCSRLNERANSLALFASRCSDDDFNRYFKDCLVAQWDDKEENPDGEDEPSIAESKMSQDQGK